MKLIALQILLICTVALGIGMGTVRAETPAEAVDQIWNSWDFSRGEAKISQDKMITLNKTIAHEQGTSVITPIMVRSKDWKGEEGLIFVPVIAFLPREITVAILNGYKKNGKPWEQQAATDFLIELDSRDVKEMVNVKETVKKYGTE